MALTYRSEHDYFARTLGIFATNKCTVSCRHCCTDSSPRVRDRLPSAVIAEQLPDAIQEFRTQWVHFSGGEPLTRPDDILVIASVAKAAGARVAVNTNGQMFASAKFIARYGDALGSVVDEAIVSTSVFHREYIDEEQLEIALSNAVKLGIYCRVHEVSGSVDAPSAGGRGPAGIDVTVSRLVASGRGAGLPHASFFDFQGACGLANKPVVLPDGSVSPCCNTPMSSRLPRFGRVTHESLVGILRRIRDDRSFALTRAFGPRFAQKVLQPGNALAGTSACEVCCVNSSR